MANRADDETGIILKHAQESLQSGIKSLFLMDIHVVTLVFSIVEAWPRRCSNGVSRIVALEELCLCERQDCCWW
jgi:hypothetical protein